MLPVTLFSNLCSFCENMPSLAGPWEDLGGNVFNEFCADTYEGWVRNHFDETDWEDAAISGSAANPAGDGLPNLLKYALGLDPRQSYPYALPPPTVQPHPETGDDEFLTLTATYPSGLVDIEFRVEVSSDLVDWSEPAVLVSSESLGRQTTRIYRDPLPAGMVDRRFMRLTVTRR